MNMCTTHTIVTCVLYHWYWYWEKRKQQNFYFFIHLFLLFIHVACYHLHPCSLLFITSSNLRPLLFYFYKILFIELCSSFALSPVIVTCHLGHIYAPSQFLASFLNMLYHKTGSLISLICWYNLTCPVVITFTFICLCWTVPTICLLKPQQTKGGKEATNPNH